MSGTSSLSVLVVEDHRDTREVFGLLLGLLGHRAELAPDAGLALVKARDRRFDVLITDVQLPGRDGWGLIHELRACGQLPPRIISMSAGDNHLLAARSKAFGCCAHLVKPFKCEELEALLQSVS